MCILKFGVDINIGLKSPTCFIRKTLMLSIPYTIIGQERIWVTKPSMYVTNSNFLHSSSDL